MSKSADAFRTISEVADWLGIPAHVLRFWESKFTQVKPVKRAGGRRYYRPADMQLLGGIRKLLHDEGMTIKGVQKVMREQGVHHVAAMSPPLDADLETTVAGIALDVPEAEEEPRGQIVSFGRTPAEAPAPTHKVAEPPSPDVEASEPVSDAPQESSAPASTSPEAAPETIVEIASDDESAPQDAAAPSAPEPSEQAEDISPNESAASDQAAPVNETVQAPFASDTAPPEPEAHGAGNGTSDDTLVEGETSPPVRAEEDTRASPAPTPKRVAQPVDPEDAVARETDARDSRGDATRPPRVTSVQTADDPPDTAPAPASTLSLLTGYKRKPTPKDAARIADIASRLSELRARMSGNAKLP